MATKTFSLQTRLSTMMEVMTRAVVRQVCEMVDGDLACLRLELARALNEKAALGMKMHELESEVEILRSANTEAQTPSKNYRSVCVQTLEEESKAPSIIGIFGKDWCSSLWDRREPRAEEEATEVEPSVQDEPEHHDHGKKEAVKEESSEKEICPSSTTADRKDPSSPSKSDDDVQEVNLVDDDDDDKGEEDDDLCFLPSGIMEAPDVHPMPPGFPGADFAKIISADGTIKHLILPSDDQLDFNEYCVPVEFMEGKPPDIHSFEAPEEDSSQDLLMDAENASNLGREENLNYFDRFDLQEEPEPEGQVMKTKFSCSECGKTFVRQSSLTLHRKCHLRQNSHTCNACKVVFPQMNLLRTHKCLPPDNTSKTLNQRFGCEQCGKRFHSMANLRVHYTVHTGERPHRCSYCGRGFSQKGNLNTHERIHRGEKPFACLTCGKRFTQKVNLNHHLGVHSGMRIVKQRKNHNDFNLMA